jgi:hypothetical protein
MHLQYISGYNTCSLEVIRLPTFKAITTLVIPINTGASSCIKIEEPETKSNYLEALEPGSVLHFLT